MCDPPRSERIPGWDGHGVVTRVDAETGAVMAEGRVEETAFPRNPLDVLAQQIVAILAAPGGTSSRKADDVFDLVRRAAPFADLPRAALEGVLDMRAGTPTQWADAAHKPVRVHVRPGDRRDLRLAT